MEISGFDWNVWFLNVIDRLKYYSIKTVCINFSLMYIISFAYIFIDSHIKYYYSTVLEKTLVKPARAMQRRRQPVRTLDRTTEAVTADFRVRVIPATTIRQAGGAAINIQQPAVGVRVIIHNSMDSSEKEGKTPTNCISLFSSPICNRWTKGSSPYFFTHHYYYKLSFTLWILVIEASFQSFARISSRTNTSSSINSCVLLRLCVQLLNILFCWLVNWYFDFCFIDKYTAETPKTRLLAVLISN